MKSDRDRSSRILGMLVPQEIGLKGGCLVQLQRIRMGGKGNKILFPASALSLWILKKIKPTSVCQKMRQTQIEQYFTHGDRLT